MAHLCRTAGIASGYSQRNTSYLASLLVSEKHIACEGEKYRQDDGEQHAHALEEVDA
jgi:hypothetical protein